MTKDEIISSLMEQLKAANEQIARQSVHIASLTAQIAEMTARLGSIEQSFKAKEDSLKKEQRKNKGLTKLIRNEGEQQSPPKPELTDDEKKVLEEARAIQRKQRGNNGARRDVHIEAKVEYHDLYPGDPDFDIGKARPLEQIGEDGEPRYRECVRYVYTPGYFTKHVYRMHTFTQDGRVFEPATPPSAFLNSNYDSSFVAGLMQLRYMYAMPVERIIHYFEDMGFNLNKKTASFLMKRAAEVFARFYEAIRQAVLGEDYIAADETYFKILVPEKNAKGKGIRKGYFWVIVAVNSGLLYVVYENGSRSGEIIYKEVDGYSGTMQSDAASFYKKIESDAFPNIIRIACLQHIKRRFIDCQDYDPDCAQMVVLLNKFYQNDHKHRIGVDGWTVQDNLKWRQEYAPDILADIRELLDKMLARTDILPKSDLAEAVGYLDMEWDAVVDIFKRGDTNLDNNLVERMNRYFSMSRRSSLFFGSHSGAERAAVLYTLALSSKMNGINLFDYIVDILDKTGTWQPNTPLAKYRDLLPDRWVRR
jgi:hypothetical protein